MQLLTTFFKVVEAASQKAPPRSRTGHRPVAANELRRSYLGLPPARRVIPENIRLGDYSRCLGASPEWVIHHRSTTALGLTTPRLFARIALDPLPRRAVSSGTTLRRRAQTQAPQRAGGVSQPPVSFWHLSGEIPKTKGLASRETVPVPKFFSGPRTRSELYRLGPSATPAHFSLMTRDG